jgi:PAS domain S-box-containing protein
MTLLGWLGQSVHLGLDDPSDPIELLDLIPLPAYVFDERTGNMLAVNSAAVDRYGYAEDEFLTLNARDIRPLDDQPLFDAMLAQHRADELYRGPQRHLTRDGCVLDVEVISRRVVYRGRPARSVVVIETTERNRMAQTLVESRRRLQALFDNARDAILFADGDARFVDTNPAACSLLEYARDELLQLRLFDLLPPEEKASSEQSWAAFLEDGARAGEIDLVARNGGRRRVEYHAVAHVLPGVHLAIVRDVTDRNRLRLEAEDKLRESHRQLRAVAARARARREEDRTRLARELHDQLGQSLAGLKMDVFWLRDRLSGAAAEPVLAKFDAMLSLLDDTIYRVRRISSDLRPAVLDRLGLIAALEWAAEEFGRRSNIATRVSCEIHEVPLDRGRSTGVFRIVQEAFTNVATHANATRVDVRVAFDGEQLVVDIADNGQGIAAASTSSDGSLGLLGMSERAALLGGTATIRRGDGGGTIVTVVVPVRERRRVPRDD